MTRDLVLEIGSAVPIEPRIAAAFSRAQTSLGRKLDAARLEYAAIEVFSTPMRVAWLVHELSDWQPDIDEQLVGPPARVAYDTSGEPTQAAKNFAAKAGVALSELSITELAAGSFVTAHQRVSGQPAQALLGAILADFCETLRGRRRAGSVADVALPEAAWLLALYGQEGISFAWNSIQASLWTRGLRQHDQQPVELESASDYEERLRGAGVIARVSAREELLQQRLEAAETLAGATAIVSQEELLSTVADLEQPLVGTVAIDAAKVALPRWVLLAVQRRVKGVFFLVGEGGVLCSEVVAVFEPGQTPEGALKERGLSAELDDCVTRYAADRRLLLSQYGAVLQGLPFHPRLGTLFEKTARVQSLVSQLGSQAGLAPEVVSSTLAAAAVCSADSATQIVARYPDLLGHAGREYALLEGWPPASAELLCEQHAPRSPGAALPNSAAAALLGVASRLDRLVGYWSVNATPAGRVDPYGSKADSLALLRILIEYSWPLSIERMVQTAFLGFETFTLDLDVRETTRKLGGFLRHRLRGLLLEEHPRDVVDPCFEAGADAPLDFARRTVAYAAVPAECRSQLAAVLSRLAAMVAAHATRDPDVPAAARADGVEAEAELATSCRAFIGALDVARITCDYPAGFAALQAFVPTLNRLLDKLIPGVMSVAAVDCLSALHRSASEWVRFERLART